MFSSRLAFFTRYISQSLNARCFSSQYKYLKVEKAGANGCVQLIQFNRPESLNALCDGLLLDLGESLREGEADSSVAAFVLTGSERSFAAGADIKEMQDKTLQVRNGVLYVHIGSVCFLYTCTIPVFARKDTGKNGWLKPFFPTLKSQKFGQKRLQIHFNHTMHICCHWTRSCQITEFFCTNY